MIIAGFISILTLHEFFFLTYKDVGPLLVAKNMNTNLSVLSSRI